METRLRKYLAQGKFHGLTLQRSRHMSSVRGRGNRTTEKRLRAAIVGAGIRGWKMHPRIPGTPDFCFHAQAVAIFVDGCFWHGCEQCGHYPRHNARFWRAKISRNRERDALTTLTLRGNGYTVLRFWEHDLSRDLQNCIQCILSALKA